MAVQKIELGSKGIRRVLSKYKPEEAIAEYVWNGYDATATCVSINILQNSIEGIEEISISDNGYGIPFTILDKGIIIKQLKIQGQPTQKRRHWRQRAAFLRGG